MSNRTHTVQQKLPAMANPTTCNPGLIDGFLSDCLDGVQESAFEQHLDQCDGSCRELQQRTAHHSLWNDARTFLSSTDSVHSDGTDQTTPIATAARQRFEREAQAAATVAQDNVIAIHGVAEFNGAPYLVMPYVKGQSLQKHIDRQGS